jgi:hypothetical protein
VRRRVAALATAGALLAAGGAAAHEVRPALLELRENAAGDWDVRWRVPARGDLRLALDVRLPEGCEPTSPPRATAIEAMHVERWRVRCAGGLAGREVAIDGLASTLTDVLVRVEHADGRTQTTRVVPASPAFRVEPSPSLLELARAYAGLGVEHILLGTDHLLFVLALLLLVDGVRRLVETVTAFTLAHSLTLAAATLGWVHVPSQPVDAAIALSIAFAAAEVVHARAGREGLARRRPWAIAFGFGLLHGVGFAGALAAAGLPERAIPLALLFFNLGVEAGQLVFIAAALAVIASLRALPGLRAERAWRVPVYAIGSVAAFWSLERVLAFWR